MSDTRITLTDLDDGLTADTVGVTVTLFSGDRGPQGPAGATGATGADGSAGSPGADGQDGTDGTDGVSITAGTGAPSGTPAVGTLYVDTSTGDLYRFA